MKCAQCRSGGTVFRIGVKVLIVLLWKCDDAFLCAKCWQYRFGRDAPGFADVARAFERLEWLCDRDLLSVELGNGSGPKV